MKPIAYINVEKRTLEFAKNIFWHTPTVANLERIPLFTQRTWEGLSVFEINDLVESTEYEDYQDLVERTEAKLKQKNGYAEEKNT